MSQTVHQQLIQSNDAYTTSLVIILLDEFGTEALRWTPQTIIMELQSLYGVMPSHSTVDRLMAGIHLVTCNSFYVSLPDFNDLCNALSWEPIVPSMFIPADAASCAWGITEAMLLSPPDDIDNAFTDDIRAFVGEVLKHEGILNPPDVLRIAHFDKNLDSKVRYDFSDDPEMFQGIYSAEESKTADINDFIKKRLRGLVMQLSSLHLKSGNVENIADKLLKALPEPDEGGSPLP